MSESAFPQKQITVSHMRLLETRARALGLDERLLIENASSNLFAVVDLLALGKSVLVVAGRGNNGADVLSCARKLVGRGYRVRVLIVREKELGAEAQFQKDVLEAMRVPLSVVGVGQEEMIAEYVRKCDFILEGILGIGIKGEVSPFLKSCIVQINDSKKKVVSCDIPSGLSPNDGIVLGAAIRADYTVTFLGAKPGFFINQGLHVCGKTFVVDIGISRETLENVDG